MIQVQINPPLEVEVNPNLLEAAAQETLRQAGPPDEVDLSIVLGGSEEIQALNREYLGEDKPTDVLSFPEDFIDIDSGRLYLGDVIIAYPVAQAQAHAAGHPVSEELQLLVVHGVLHLLGRDHAEADEEAEMWAAQASILEALGAGSAARRAFDHSQSNET